MKRLRRPAVSDRNDVPGRWLWLATLCWGLIAAGCSGGDDDDAFSSPSPEERNLQSYAGDFYDEFLKASPYSKLKIEVDAYAGFEPDDGALQTLVDYISLLCNKPGGIELLPIETIAVDPNAGENPEYTLDEVNAIELEHRDNYTDTDTAVMYFLYLDGHSDYDDESEGLYVLGYAYHGSSMAIFEGTLNRYLPIIRPSLEKIVTVHEFGHIAGLVNNGADMVVDHLDPEDHGPHCDNTGCMMYWLNNTSVADIVQDMIDCKCSTVDLPDFDDNCLADLANVGGKDARGMTQPN